MKLRSYSCALIFFFLLFMSSKLSAGSLATKQGLEEVKLNEIINGVSLKGRRAMRVEHICGKEDAECLKRRVLPEVHLDYIYTEHHKP